MPRAGGSSSDGLPGPGAGRVASAFPLSVRFRKTSRVNVRSVALACVVVLAMRNILFRDYRVETRDAYKDAGITSDEQLERYVPKTLAERQRYAKDKANDMTRMKDDIAYLLQEVDLLRKQQELHRKGGGERTDPSDPLSEMDQIHAEKRRHKEAKDATTDVTAKLEDEAVASRQRRAEEHVNRLRRSGTT